MKNTILMNAQEVAEELGVSKASAYKMIHVWNEKLQKMGTPRFRDASAESISWNSFTV